MTVSDLSGRYAPVIAGLAIGTAAKYGLTLGEGRRLTWRGVVADLLLLGMLGLLSVVVCDRFGLTGDVKAFASALAAVSSDRLLRLIRKRFETIADQQLEQLTRVANVADLAKVPAGQGMPDAVRAEVITDPSPLGSTLRSAFRNPTRTRPPEDQIELLRRLDDTD
ncbi:hypothetical protein [Sphingomonas sp. MMS24-J13]|uniref:hypothetical protein n=1 Tax=Sphingomonas sp. MMS24-J13 TaxID=3238686 RepID=UPI00384E2423